MRTSGALQNGLACLLLGAALLAAQACSTSTPKGAKPVSFAGQEGGEARMAEATLQDHLFRFANRFFSEVRDAIAPLEASRVPAIRREALLRRLMYGSSVLDVALGESPQANLMDMVAFVDLCRDAWKTHWVPEVFGTEGDALTRVFDHNSREIWALASQVMSETGRAELDRVIRSWRAKHPDQVSVENVRLSEFADEAGASAEAQEVSGLLASVEGATAVGDRALLLGNRALYYAQRAPFLMRAQAQAATREMLEEAAGTLASTRSLIGMQPQIHAMLTDLTMTFESLSRTVHLVSQHPAVVKAGTEGLGSLVDALREWTRIVSSPGHPAAVSQLAGSAETLGAHADRFLWRVFGLAAGLILLAGLVLLGVLVTYARVRRAPALAPLTASNQDRHVA